MEDFGMSWEGVEGDDGGGRGRCGVGWEGGKALL